VSGYNRLMEPANNDERILREVQNMAREFEARAQETDTAGPGNPLLENNVRTLAKIGFYGSRIPAEFGGLGIALETVDECQELIAAACGVTAFTQQQLHSGGAFVGQSADVSLKEELLPKFAGGQLLCGVAFSHLRRPGPPMVRIEKVADGYLINGEAPWVTGWRFLDAFSLGATLPDGSITYSYIAIRDHAKSLIVSEPIKVSVMNSGDTVRVLIKDLFIPDRFMLFKREPDHQKRFDYGNIAGPIQMPLGCARGCAGQLRAIGASRNNPIFMEAAEHFECEVDAVRREARNWNASRSGEPGYKERALAARAHAIRLAMRAAEACIAASSGAAHLLTNPAQRRHREASFYATVAQTTDTQSALLEALTYDK